MSSLIVPLIVQLLVFAQDAPRPPSTAEPNESPLGILQADRDAGVVIRVVKTGGIAGVWEEGKVFAEGRILTVGEAERHVLPTAVFEIIGTARDLPEFQGPPAPMVNSLCRDCFVYHITILSGKGLKYFSTDGIGLSEQAGGILQRIRRLVER